MKLHSFFILTAVSFASLPLRPAFALAQGESPASLEYVAPTPDCVSNDAFQALVKEEIARFPSSERNRRLLVRIVQQEGLYAATLTTETGAVRTITAARCDDVTAALAVIIAVAEPSGVAPADMPSPPANRSAQVDLSQPSEPDRQPQGSASRLEWRAGARGFISMHPSPSGNVGGLGAVSLELPWGFRKMMFEVGGGMSTTMFAAPPVDTTYLILDTQACLLDLPIGSTGLSVLGCLRLDGAEFRAARVGGNPPGPGSAWPPPTTGGAFWTGARTPALAIAGGRVRGRKCRWDVWDGERRGGQ
jgi:hypothetical protein